LELRCNRGRTSVKSADREDNFVARFRNKPVDDAFRIRLRGRNQEVRDCRLGHRVNWRVFEIVLLSS
jgi:hypothetical protein